MQFPLLMQMHNRVPLKKQTLGEAYVSIVNANIAKTNSDNNHYLHKPMQLGNKTQISLSVHLHISSSQEQHSGLFGAFGTFVLPLSAAQYNWLVMT